MKVLIILFLFLLNYLFCVLIAYGITQLFILSGLLEELKMYNYWIMGFVIICIQLIIGKIKIQKKN